MNRVIIAVGSNIDPKTNIKKAETLIKQIFNFIDKSDFVETEAIGIQDAKNFINGAWLVESSLSMYKFNKILKTIEKELLRDESQKKWASRTIDLDIVVWNNKIIDKDYYTRDFLRESVDQIISENPE